MPSAWATNYCWLKNNPVVSSWLGTIRGLVPRGLHLARECIAVITFLSRKKAQDFFAS